MAAVVVEVQLLMSKVAIGSALKGNEFEFGLFNEAGTKLFTARNQSDGLIEFRKVAFTAEGLYHYTVKETEAPPYWSVDDTVYPVDINVVKTADNKLEATVTYPAGVPVFKNTKHDTLCGAVVFPELEFSAPGVYEYTLKELTPDGGGWETDKGERKVFVKVIDDGYGNLVATFDYDDDGFPQFVNTYKAKPAHIIISACKKAVGADLPSGRFEFGLYNASGQLIAKVKNGPAYEEE